MCAVERLDGFRTVPFEIINQIMSREMNCELEAHNW